MNRFLYLTPSHYDLVCYVFPSALPFFSLRIRPRRFRLGLFAPLWPFMLGRRRRPTTTPLDQNLKPDADSGTTTCEPNQYPQLSGSLIYLTITRRDVSHPVGLLSQFMQTPRGIHLDCEKRVLRYMSRTMDRGIL